MATVITREAIEKHNIEKYSFKVIAFGKNGEGEKKSTFAKEEQAPTQEMKNETTQAVDSSALSTSSKDALIESLMKKTDEMSSNFIKLQMKLEQKEEEFEQKLKKAKEEAFAEGVEAGKAQAKEEIDQHLSQALELYMNSAKKLDASAQEFKIALENIKNELVGAAVDIAQEVIKIELSEHSHEVVKVLSEELIKELQSASKITLKINPKDFALISEELAKLHNVEVVADNAISEGGVVVMSDAGNIDAQISKRFERVKKAALSE